ncbi:MAG: prephenate dehydratase [archaeon]
MIGILGPMGTFTEEAAIKYCEDININRDIVPYQTISEVFQAVRDDKIPEGIVPMENFLNGHVMETLDNLNKNGVKIKRAIVLPIHHCLITILNTNNIEIIKSHPQALAQCSDYLDKNYPNIERIGARSTANAMKEIVENNLNNVAVIGSESGAKRYGLNILEKRIENNNLNKTMFIVIGKEESEKSERSRTSFVIIPTANKTGLLRSILSIFADENIDLKMIQSRPDGKGSYIFYIDIEGHIEDENVVRAFAKLKNMFDDSAIKIFGSYPYVSFSGT